MKTIRYGVDPDPITVDVRLKILADEGLDGANFGISADRLRYLLEPSHATELSELISGSPLGRRSLVRFLPKKGPSPGADPNGYAKDAQPGIASYGEAIHDPPDGGGGEDADLDDAVKRLAAMSIGHYEAVRKSEAARLGVRAPVLDKLVAAARPQGETVPGQGQPLVLDDPEPWPDPVDGAALLDRVEAIIGRYRAIHCVQPRL